MFPFCPRTSLPGEGRGNPFQIAFWTIELTPFVKRLPAASGNFIPVAVREIRPSLRPSYRARRWETLVHAPYIRVDGARPDRDWDWVWEIPILTFAVGVARRPRIFQLSLALDDFPLGMIALLENERWPTDHAQPAVYVWYVTGAPFAAVAGRGDPKLRTAATLDIAVTIGLNSAADGRLWLHAAPEGGDTLLRWYTEKGFEQVAGHIVLPSGLLVPRENDGRYFQLTATAAADFSRGLDGCRR